MNRDHEMTVVNAEDCFGVKLEDDEVQAVTTILLKMLCADAKIAPAELTARGRVYERFGITTYRNEQNLLPFDEACQIYRTMSETKRKAVKQALHELAMADGQVHADEQAFVKSIDESSL